MKYGCRQSQAPLLQPRQAQGAGSAPGCAHARKGGRPSAPSAAKGVPWSSQVSATLLGEPDLGLLSPREMADRTGQVRGRGGGRG